MILQPLFMTTRTSMSDELHCQLGPTASCCILRCREVRLFVCPPALHILPAMVPSLDFLWSNQSLALLNIPLG